MFLYHQLNRHLLLSTHNLDCTLNFLLCYHIIFGDIFPYYMLQLICLVSFFLLFSDWDRFFFHWDRFLSRKDRFFFHWDHFFSRKMSQKEPVPMGQSEIIKFLLFHLIKIHYQNYLHYHQRQHFSK